MSDQSQMIRGLRVSIPSGKLIGRTAAGHGQPHLIDIHGQIIQPVVNQITPKLAVGANPTATASDVAVNGTATTFMRSDAAPAVQKCSSSVFGLAKVDGTTITASGGVISSNATSSPAFHPGYQSGQYYSTPTENTSFTALTANILYATPFYVPQATTFTKISCQVISGAAGTHCELGIYSNSNGVPHSLEYDCGNVATATTGNKEITGLSLALSAGWHFLVVASDGAPTLYCANTTSNLMNFLLGYDDPSGVGLEISGSWTYSTGNLPATFPTISYTHNKSVPMVFLRL